VRELDAWLEGRLVGRFSRGDDRRVRFQYTDDVTTPISLSLTRDGSWTKNAPINLLNNLLPDREETRHWMARALGAASIDTFDLLDKAGADIAGGLVLVPSGVDPHLESEQPVPATDDEIAARIAALKRDRDAWYDTVVKPRFSLAGSQAKFALADRSGDWFWSSASLPSTHILKPAATSVPFAQEIEIASMRLSALVGIDTPDVGMIEVFDQSSYIVERFDRDRAAPVAIRIHTEDFAQAAGLATDRKYAMSALQAIELLRRADVTDELGYGFVQRLAFNTSIANADAHAKNYSLLIRPDAVRLAPMYDTLVTSFWPHVDNRLAMKIGGADRAPQVSLDHWAKLARLGALDTDRVVGIAHRTARAVLEHFDQAFGDLPATPRDEVRAIVTAATRHTA
jgi:serine/threonine-protein kinase HipA